MVKKVDISVVIPVYNSGEIFPILYSRLSKVLSKITNSHEIITVLDGCQDNSLDVINEIHTRDDRVKIIELSRNFGEEAALNAGLVNSKGELVVVMDDDLEDPPEVIPSLISKSKEGYDVVYGVITTRKVSFIKRFLASLYYKFLNKVSSIDMPNQAGSFGLIRRNVVDEINSMPERNRYMRGMRSWVGFNQIGIEYERGKRLHGKSGYNLLASLRFAINAILSFSYKPLDWLATFGFLLALSSFILGIRLLILRLWGLSTVVPGWLSIMLAVLFLGGLNLLALGLLGKYLAMVYDEAKKRPLYIVRKKIGFEND